MIDWKERAACRGMDPSVFFPPSGNRKALARARAICEGCQSQEDCLLIGIDQTEGIFAGTTPRQRKSLVSVGD
ncbi:MAG: WhiB family transcriptional regulator [Acidimicrobiia bacterium]|nr:WhiB family transcriptional regulator [Acidimicrobiia bacterium]